jgi:hypothetical protein
MPYRGIRFSECRLGCWACPGSCTFASSADKVIELVERGSGLTERESRLMLNQAIATGRGGVLH